MKDKWDIEYINEARKDLERLDRSSQVRVLKAIDRVSSNPLPSTEGGYGKPLGNRNISNLTGLLKIKIKSPAIRVVYRLVRDGKIMRIVVIAIRDDDYVYKEAAKRTDKE
jgi:mRNA interferase RelE/StbE